MTTHNAPSPQSSPRRGEEDNRNSSSHFRERNIIELPLSLARKEINKILLSFESEAIIKIPLSLEGEGQGEGEIEAYPEAHFLK